SRSSSLGKPEPTSRSIAASTSYAVRRSSTASPTTAQNAARSPSNGSPTLPAFTTRTPSTARSNCACVCPQTTTRCATPATASRLQALEALRRERAPDDVAAGDDGVHLLALDLREHGLERRQVAVDVVERGDAHAADATARSEVTEAIRRPVDPDHLADHV